MNGVADTEQATNVPLINVVMAPEAKKVLLAYRSFDRQYVIADARLLDRPRPALWHARSVEGQIFAVEQHSHHPGAGPGMMFSNLMPDQHSFNNRGGRALPLFHPDGSPNVAPGLLAALSKVMQREVTALELLSYVAAVTSHPHYTELYSEDLRTPGIRIPLTKDAELWAGGVELGEEILWLHTFGSRFTDPVSGRGADVRQRSGVLYPTYLEAVKGLPDVLDHDEATNILKVGTGRFGGVSKDVYEFQVGGVNVLKQWFGYRKQNPNGKITSELDRIVPNRWESQWTEHLLEVLSVLTQLVEAQEFQAKLLDDIVSSELFSREELALQGVVWPVDAKGSTSRSVRYPTNESLFDF